MNATKPLPPTDVIVLDAMRRTPAVEKAVADRARAIVLDRQKLRERLVEVEDGQLARHYLNCVKRHEETIAAARAAYDAFQAAEQRVAEAETARVNASFTILQCREEVVAALHAGADNAAIDEFVRWLRTELTTTRKAQETREVTSRNRVTGKSTTRFESNGEAVATRTLAINEALHAAEALRLLADQAVVPERIVELKAALPPPVAQVASSGKEV
jgi:hypothetical protein